MICGGYDDIHFLKLGPWTRSRNFGTVGFERCKMVQAISCGSKMCCERQAGQPPVTHDCYDNKKWQNHKQEMTYTQYPTMICLLRMEYPLCLRSAESFDPIKKRHAGVGKLCFLVCPWCNKLICPRFALTGLEHITCSTPLLLAVCTLERSVIYRRRL